MGIYNIETIKESAGLSTIDESCYNEAFEEYGIYVTEALLDDWKFKKEDLSDLNKVKAFMNRINKESKDPSVRDVVLDSIVGMGIGFIASIPILFAPSIAAVYATGCLSLILSLSGVTYVCKRHDRLIDRMNKQIKKIEKKMPKMDDKSKDIAEKRIKELKECITFVEKTKKEHLGLK